MAFVKFTQSDANKRMFIITSDLQELPRDDGEQFYLVHVTKYRISP